MPAWNFSVWCLMANLYCVGRMHLVNQSDPNTSYPFDKKALFVAKGMANLYHLSRMLLSDQPDPNTSYPFDKKAFFAAKRMANLYRLGLLLLSDQPDPCYNHSLACTCIRCWAKRLPDNNCSSFIQRSFESEQGWVNTSDIWARVYKWGQTGEKSTRESPLIYKSLLLIITTVSHSL